MCDDHTSTLNPYCDDCGESWCPNCEAKERKETNNPFYHCDKHKGII